MRNLLAFLATALLVFLGLGWYLDWYSFKSVPAGAPGLESFNIDINKDKINRDVAKGMQEGEEKLHQTMDKKTLSAASEKHR